LIRHVARKGRDKKRIQDLVGNRIGKSPFVRPRHRWDIMLKVA